MLPSVPLALLALALLAACGTTTATTPTTATERTATTTTTAPVPAGTLSFGAPQPVAHGVGLAAVSCGAASACVAFDASGHAYEFDGSTWSGPQVVAGATVGPGTISVSCATTTLCVAAPTGGDDTVTWNGQSWSAPTTLEGADGIEGIGCAPSGYCAAVDGEGNAFAYGGGGWSRTSGDWGAVTAISCASSSFCASSSGGLSVWDGSSWTMPSTFGVPTSFTGVSCTTAGFCMAVDELGQALQWNGQAWSAPVAVDPSGTALSGVSCPTSSFCVAVDELGGLAQWHAGSWTRSDVDGTEPFTAVSCPTATFCVAVDHAGRALVGRPA